MTHLTANWQPRIRSIAHSIDLASPCSEHRSNKREKNSFRCPGIFSSNFWDLKGDWQRRVEISAGATKPGSVCDWSWREVSNWKMDNGLFSLKNIFDVFLRKYFEWMEFHSDRSGFEKVNTASELQIYLLEGDLSKYSRYLKKQAKKAKDSRSTVYHENSRSSLFF